MVSSSRTQRLLLLLLLLFCCHLPIRCSGQDRITRDSPVKDSQTIVSVGEAFALGFFSLGNSSNRYVGIWYNNIPVPTVVWVANRDDPVTDSSGELAIARDGNLVVLDGRNNTLWSTNMDAAVTGSEDVSAVLLDSGNLVLGYGNETRLWESFDYPTNTFLPGMKMRLNLTTLKAWNLRSWKNDYDPGSGAFSLGIETRGPLAEVVMWRGSQRFWRSGSVWNGEMFSRLNQNENELVSYVTLIARDQEVYVTIAVSDDSIQTRFVLTPSGRIQQLSWQQSSQRWDPVWWSLSKECFSYNYCGAFGSCNISGDGRDCDCLQGYVPKNQEEWDRGNHSSGCARRRELSCGKEGGDGFFKVEQTTLPDLPISVGKSSIEECEAHCRSNCSCLAYSFANVTWANATCLIWERDLIDIEGNPPRGQVLYLRLDSSEQGDMSPSKNLILPIVLPTAGAFVCLIGIFVYCLWGRIHKWAGSKKQDDFVMIGDTSESKNAIASEVPLFQFHSVVTATNNFDKANKLGEGGFGPVYKGRLQDQDVAVKRLAESSSQGLMEMRNEVELIAKLQHKNLVRLLGWCTHGEEKMLIYEYLPNKSLDQFLFDPRQKAILDWKLRFSIIDGIAQGLLYLHRYSRLKIIHRDLKASNILLDGEMNPKISDFGLARIFGSDQKEASTKRVVGTFGYMAPEYSLDGHFSEKSDVFSFGVLLIEIVSGQKNTGFFTSDSSVRLLGNAWQLWKEGRGTELMDPICKESFDGQQVLKCINVGLLCVQDNPNERPTMGMIVSMLGSDGMSLPEPKMPVFSSGSSIAFSSSSVVNSKSVNFVTLTTQSPR